MPALITADLHLTDNPRDEYRFAFMRRLPELARKRNIDCIVILGDLTEEKDRHSAELVNRIVSSLYALSQSVSQLIISRGNHDYINPDVPFYHFLKYIPNITWINKPTKMETPDDAIGSSLFLPHTNDYKRDWEVVNWKDKPRWVFAHNTFDGADVGFGRRLTGIPLNAFPAGTRVISGDVHIPQRLGCVTYVGAPYTIDFGDDYDPRLLILDGDKASSLLLAGVQKRLVEVRNVDELDRQPDISEGDILKVRLHISSEDYDRWHEMVDKVRAWGEQRGMVIHSIHPVVQFARKKKHTVRRQQSDEELLEQYARATGLDDRTLRTGLYLMER